jgi:nitroreductase
VPDFLELCRRRHSLRRYADKPVEKEKILRCLEAARLAPSASNGQPWRFVVVDDPELRARLCDAVFTGVFAHSRRFAQAPVIVALLVKTGLAMQIADRALGTQFEILDAGIAGEHFCLAAAEQGLGTCWIGWYEPRALGRLLGLKAKGCRPVALLALGYPAPDATVPAKQRRPLAEIVGWNRLP